jgi:hypothetical protein
MTFGNSVMGLLLVMIVATGTRIDDPCMVSKEIADFDYNFVHAQRAKCFSSNRPATPAHARRLQASTR